MTRATRRDPVSDELLTPENSAFVLIDYQPTQVDSINSMDRAKLIDNIAVTTKIIQTYKVPVVLSTVNVVGTRLIMRSSDRRLIVDARNE